MNRDIALPAACAALALLLAAGCSKPEAKERRVDVGTRTGVLHLGNGTEPQNLDPHTVTGVPEFNLLQALFEGLTALDPKSLHPVPGAAAAWTISEDQTVYTFHLQPEARWSNGDPVTAHDFVYSWKRMLSPGLAAEYAYMLYYMKNAAAYNAGKITDFAEVGAKAVDDRTLVVTLENSTPFFLTLLAHGSWFPVHRATIEKFDAFEDAGTKWTRPGNLVGNGPFSLKTWELNQVIVVERNATYWDAATVRLKAIHFYPIDSQQTEELNFRSGQLHATSSLPINKIKTYKDENPDVLMAHPYLGTYFYRFNTTRKPFDDVRVRRALALAIDRQAIVESVIKGGQLPAFNLTPPATAGYTAEARLTYDVEQARELLAAAGYANGEGFPTAEILYNTSESHKLIAQAIQQMWKTGLNIDVTLMNQEWKVYLDTQKSMNYTISRASWIGDYLDPNTFLDMWLTDGGNNRTGWSNADYDRLIAEAGRTRGRDERYRVFQRAEKILVDEVPIIPIYFYTHIALLSPDVKGWLPNTLDYHPYKHVYLQR